MAEQNQEWVYVKRPEKEVTQEHYELRTVPIPVPNDGEVLLKSLYISVDPYQRIQQAARNSWEEPHPLDTVQVFSLKKIVKMFRERVLLVVF